MSPEWNHRCLFSLSLSLSIYIYFKFYLFIYFCMCWVFVAALGATLHCSAGASHCGGFSRCRARDLERAGLSSCGTQVACGIFPDRGQTRVPWNDRRIPNHSITREVCKLQFLKVHRCFFLRKRQRGTSLVVQWVRLSLSKKGTWV